MKSKGKTAKIERALAEMKEASGVEVARRGVLHFPVDEASIMKIYDVAAKKGQSVGFMVRDWVLEKLELEQKECEVSANKKVHRMEERLYTAKKKPSKSLLPKKRARA